MKEDRLSGLIGHPLGHSVSPFIHEFLGNALGFNVKYGLFDINEEDIETSCQRFGNEGFYGLNVTIPYKNVIMKNLVTVDEAAQRIGAVNTIVNTGKGFAGYNTDYLGLKRELEYFGVDVKGKNVVILGAGGASRAVKYLCTILGAKEIRQFNRTPGKDGSEDINEVLKLKENQKQIVFQTTSVGLFPNCDAAPVMDDEFYEGIEAGIDIIYNPLDTLFMKKVKAQGGQAYNGLRMLLYQAIEAFKLFYDIDYIPEETEEDCYLQLLLNMNQKIVLCGMMGCGKSTLGKKLASKADALFIDTDELIEENARMSINDIFETKGEAGFRQMEHETLAELLVKYRNTDQKIVYSLGGGMCNSQNMDLIKQLGYVCYIKCDVDTLCKRLKDDTSRPLLKDTDLRQKIDSLLNVRSSLYMEACDEVINN